MALARSGNMTSSGSKPAGTNPTDSDTPSGSINDVESDGGNGGVSYLDNSSYNGSSNHEDRSNSGYDATTVSVDSSSRGAIDGTGVAKSQALREQRLVRCSKFAIFGFLTVAASSAAAATYVLFAKSQRSEFESQVRCLTLVVTIDNLDRLF